MTKQISKRAIKKDKEYRILYHIGDKPAYPHPRSIRKNWGGAKSMDGELYWERPWLKEPVAEAAFLTDRPFEVATWHGRHGNVYIYKVPEGIVRKAGGIHRYDLAREILIPKELWHHVKLIGKMDKVTFRKKWLEHPPPFPKGPKQKEKPLSEEEFRNILKENKEISKRSDIMPVRTQEEIFDDVLSKLPEELRDSVQHASGGIPDVTEMSDVDISLYSKSPEEVGERLGLTPSDKGDNWVVYSLPGYERDVNLYVTDDKDLAQRSVDHRKVTLFLREKHPDFYEKAKELKRSGLSTEEAWAKVLGLGAEGDPYEIMRDVPRKFSAKGFSVLGPGGVDPSDPYGGKNVKIPGRDPMRQKQIRQKRLPTEEIIIDPATGKQIWITTTARLIARKTLNLPKIRNVFLNMAIARTFASAKPKYSWRVHLRALKPNEVGHIRYGSGLRGSIWKMVAIEKANRIAVIWMRPVG